MTAVEVGDLKQEIAYHGDTVNTVACIQGLCNQYQETLLVLVDVADLVSNREDYLIREIGLIALKGKEGNNRRFAVDKMVS